MSGARVLAARRHDPLDFRGRVEVLTVESDALRGNALGDPHVRELPVYVPPGIGGEVEGTAGDGSGAGARAELPLVVLLAGFTGRGQAFLETHPWRRGVLWRYDRAVAAGEAAPAIVALPDCFTALGGSQYVNSSAVGRYEDHVADELVPLVEERYPVARGRRAVAGKSSGGFGALHLCLARPGLFAACASISGDVGFHYTFPTEFLVCLRELARRGEDPAGFLRALRARPELGAEEHAIVSVLAMAACYSPNPAAELGFDLPFDLRTGALVDEVWSRWLAFDPLVRVDEPGAADALRRLRLLHLECGLADEYHLQWGLRLLVEKLRALDVPHRHEEHPGSHRGLDDRYVPVLHALAKAATEPASGVTPSPEGPRAPRDGRTPPPPS